MVATVNSNVSDMREKVRRQTGSVGTDQLTNDEIDKYLQTAYTQDVPADIKSNLFREVVEVFTVPNVDRYALAGNLANNAGPNTFESIREPVYVEGRRARFYKDRGQFYADWPRTASLDTSLVGGALTGSITAIDISGAPTVEITTASTTGLQDGDAVTFSGIVGTTELNGNTYGIANVTATTFEVTQAAPTAYVSGGTWSHDITRFTLNIGAPVLQNELVVGSTFGGQYQSFQDDGDLNGTGTGTIISTSGSTTVGTVVYATGAITLAFSSAPDANAQITVWYYTYTASRPFGVMWWKNELIVRPVPDRVYRIEIEAYRYPTAFSSDTSTPILNQWWQYIADLASIKVFQDRQDDEGVASLQRFVDRQERLIRNRIANEQIGQRNATIYEGSEFRGEFPIGFGYF